MSDQMGHAGRIAGDLDEKQRIKKKRDEQQNQEMPEFSLEYYLHSHIDLFQKVSRDINVAIDDWNDQAKNPMKIYDHDKQKFVEKSALQMAIENKEIIPVTAFNLSKEFNVYLDKRGFAEKHLSEEIYADVIKENPEKANDLDTIFRLQKTVLENSPVSQLYHDMKAQGIDVHIGINPQLSSNDGSEKKE